MQLSASLRSPCPSRGDTWESYLGLPEYMLAYSALTSSKLFAFPSSRFKDSVGKVKARVTEGEVWSLSSLSHPPYPGGPWVVPEPPQIQSKGVKGPVSPLLLDVSFLNWPFSIKTLKIPFRAQFPPVSETRLPRPPPVPDWVPRKGAMFLALLLSVTSAGRCPLWSLKMGSGTWKHLSVLPDYK